MVTKEAWLGHRDEFGDALWKKSRLPHWLTYGRKIYCICVLVNRCPVWLLSHARLPKSVVILGTSNRSRDLLCKRTSWLGLPGCTRYWAFPHACLMSSNNFFWAGWGYFPTLLCSQCRWREAVCTCRCNLSGNAVIFLQYVPPLLCQLCRIQQSKSHCPSGSKSSRHSPDFFGSANLVNWHENGFLEVRA